MGAFAGLGMWLHGTTLCYSKVKCRAWIETWEHLGLLGNSDIFITTLLLNPGWTNHLWKNVKHRNLCLTLEILMQRVCGEGDLGPGISLNSLDESRTNFWKLLEGRNYVWLNFASPSNWHSVKILEVIQQILGSLIPIHSFSNYYILVTSSNF